MSSGQIFRKTMPFVWAKLLLGLITVGFSAILFAVLMGLSWLFNSGGVTGILFLIWISAVGIIRLVVMHYFGYLFKAGHIAVITEAVTTGKVPDNQVAYGKQMVKERFATSNIYFAVDKLVSGAVKQIQRGIEKVGNALDFIPGMDAITSLAKFFVDISLGYIDECCLGYTFYKTDDSAFKSAADGVAIYAQNWKKLLKDAAKTMAVVILALIIITLLCFVALGLLFRLLHWSGFVAFALSVFVALAVKFAFIDSYILVKMMSSYMEVAPTTPITFDLYHKLCEVSTKFKELFQKGQQDQPAYTAAEAAPSNTSASSSGETQDKPVFCSACGAKNEAYTKFCISCGSKLN